MVAILITLLICINSVFAQQDEINIVLDPNDLTPLSAIAELPDVNTEPIMIVVVGKTKETSIGVVYPAGFGDELPIHGLYEDYTNKVIIKVGNKPNRRFAIITKKQEFTTKPMPTEDGPREDRPFTVSNTVNIDTLPPSQIFNNDLYFTSFPNAYYMMGFDRTGELRYVYYHPNEHPSMMRMEQDGTNVYMLYTSDNKFYVKRDLLGNEIFKKRYNVHHEVVPYTDGKELALGNSEWGWEDAIYELDKDKNLSKVRFIGDAIRKVTDSNDNHLLNNMLYDYNNIYITNDRATRVDWAHANSLVYDKQSDLLYVSLRHLGVLAIQYESWELKWFLVDETLKTAQGLKYGQKPRESIYLTDIPSLQKYRLKTGRRNSPRGQHALLLKPDNEILLFDNRSRGPKNPRGSRVVLYKIDTNNMTANIVREFVNEQRSYSRYVGDVDLSGDNHQNWLIYYGFAHPRRVVEVDSNNKVLFDMIIDSGSLSYRIDKFPLYPYRNKNKKYSEDISIR